MSTEKFEDFVGPPETHEEGKPERPTVVLVFAILTFIGCALAMFGVATQFSYSHILPVVFPIATIIFCIFKIVGAARMIAMWKNGFYLYAFGEIASYLVAIFSSSYQDELFDYQLQQQIDAGLSGEQLEAVIAWTEWAQNMMPLWWGISIALTALWLGVYGANLKKMRA